MQPAEPREAHLIDWGWATPRLQDMPGYLDAAQQTAFDGAVIDVHSDRDPRGLSWDIFGETPLDPAELDALVAAYGNLDWGRYEHNFLRYTVHPADVGWFEDWDTIYANAEAWSGFARELGFVGVMFDVEQYSDANLFEYPAQAGAETGNYSVFMQQAYERGAAFMDVVERGFPGITVMTTFGLLVDPNVTDAGDWQRHHYGLLLPFLEGMLSAADDETTLIDGYENAYLYRTEAEFTAVHDMMNAYEPLYTDRLAQPMQVGYGLWVDVHCGDGGLPPEGCGFSQEDFREALTYATAHTDGYVWVYSQKINWYTGYGIPGAWRDLFAEFR